MALSDIHSCSKIFADNLELKVKLQWLSHEKDKLERELAELKKTLEGSPNVRKFAVKKDVGVQTDVKSWVFWQSSDRKKGEEPKEKLKESDILKMNKVVEMHSQLLKRYDKEVKLNMTLADTISDLNVCLSKSEEEVRVKKQKIMTLERDLLLWKAKSKGHNYEQFCEGDAVLREVVKEKHKLAAENEHLRRELRGLDPKFFEEVEDMKFALQQLSKLNKAYRHMLNTKLKAAGASCPSPEHILKHLDYYCKLPAEPIVAKEIS